VYYIEDAVIWLTENNQWEGQWEGSRLTKRISFFRSDDKLKIIMGTGEVYHLDVEGAKNDEVIAWQLTRKSYLECRPGGEFLEQLGKLPNYGKEFLQNL